MFNIEQEDLNEVLTLIVSTITDKTEDKASIYSYVYLQSQDNYITIKASSQSASFISTIPATNIEKPFNVCIPYRKLQSLVKLLKGELVFKEAPNGRITIIANKSRHTLATRNGDDFPKISGEFHNLAVLPAKILKDMITKASIAAARIDTNSWTLRCINLRLLTDTLELRTCNGSNIAVCSVKAGSEYLFESINYEVLIPAQSLSSMINLIKKGTEMCQLSYSNNQVAIRIDNSVLYLRTVSGVFPDVSKVISKLNNETSFVVDKSDLLLAIKRSQVMSKGLAIWIKVDKTGFMLSTEKEVAGDSIEFIDLLDNNLSSQDKIFVGLNKQQLLTFLGVIESNPRFLFGTPGTDTVVIVPSLDEYDFTFVTAPMVQGPDTDE